MHISVGPVAGDAARAWTAHLLANLEILRGQLDRLPFRVPLEVLDEFAALLETWRRHADGDVFVWQADLDEAHVRNLVRYWANLDSLGDDAVAALGISWSPAEARPFFDALAAGVAAAFAGAGGPDPFAELLVVHSQQPLDDPAER